MSKKISVTMAMMLATALWMLSGGALLAAAQDSSAGADSAAESAAMFPADEAVPAGSTVVPDGTTASDGTVIPDGSILLMAGAVLSDGTVVAPGTVLYPDGTLMVFGDTATWPVGSLAPASFTPIVANDLPFTGGNQGMLAAFGMSLIVLGTAASVARKRLVLS